MTMMAIGIRTPNLSQRIISDKERQYVQDILFYLENFYCV